jgi:hypothetical protein
MAKNGHMYTYDAEQNVTFPKNVTATTFIGNLTGNAATATKATQDGNGNVITSTYAIKSEIPSVGNATITVSAGNGLTTGGSFTTNASSAKTITLNVGAGVGIAVAADAVKAKLKSETALTADSSASTSSTGRVLPVSVDKSGYLSTQLPWSVTETTDSSGNVTITFA